MRNPVSAATSAFCALTALALLHIGPTQAQTRSDLVQRSALRVCADPSNLPFSDKDRAGFENKLADLLGEWLDVPVTYTWFPQAIGFVRKTLRERKCDIIMGYAQGHELVQNTNHYYRSSYALLLRSGSGLDSVEALADPRLQGKRIGVIAGTPPATVLALNGLIGKAKPYQLMVDRRHENPADQMVSELMSGEIDAGLLWGPIAGYYAGQHGDKIRIVPLLKEKRGPRMIFRITMGIRRGELDWKRQLNSFIRKKQKEINAILLSYHVPILDEQDHLITQ